MIRVLILLLHYSNTAPMPFTPAQAQATFDSTTGAFYQNASYGLTAITEEAHGWYRLPCTKTTCTWDQIDAAATAAARSQGIDTDSFDHRYYLISGGVPNSICDGSPCGVGALNGGTVWDSANTDPATQIHEFGHSIGLLHADLGPIGGGGVYGTDSETLLAAQRNQLGWLDATLILAAGVYQIISVEQLFGTRAYLIPKIDGSRYILDYRQSYYGAPVLFVERDEYGGYVYVEIARIGQSVYDSTEHILISLNTEGNVAIAFNALAPTPTPASTPVPTSTPRGHHKG